MEMLSGADMIVRSMIDQGVKHIFGYPGGSVLDIYDALHEKSDIEHVLVRHEQAAVHMADGYARATGEVGVVLVTSGPGATNAITGIATAYMDSIPMVVLSGQVPLLAQRMEYDRIAWQTNGVKEVDNEIHVVPYVAVSDAEIEHQVRYIMFDTYRRFWHHEMDAHIGVDKGRVRIKANLRRPLDLAGPVLGGRVGRELAREGVVPPQLSQSHVPSLRRRPGLP